MAISLDGTSSSSGVNGTASSYTWTHTVGSGLNKGALFVTSQRRDLNSINAGSITGLTWNSGTSQNLTKLSSVQNSTDGLWADVWGIAGPNAGLGTVTVTLANTTDNMTGGALSLSGVDQSTLIDGSAVGTGQAVAGGTATITTKLANCWILDSLYQKSGNQSTFGVNQTKIFELFPRSVNGTTHDGSGDTSDSSYQITTTPGAYSNSYTWSPSDDMAIAVIAIRPSPAGTSLIQSSGTAVLALGSTSTVWSANPTTGNLIVVGVALTNAAVLGTVTSITDSQSNTYVRAVRGTISSASDVLNAEIWYATNITGGAGSVTVTHTVDNTSMFAREYSGFSTLDAIGSASGSNTNPNSGTSNTAFSNELLIIATGDDKGATQTWSPAGIYGDIVGTATTLTGLSMEDSIVSATAAQTGTLVLGASANWDSLFASFYLPATGGATPVTYITLLGAGQI